MKKISVLLVMVGFVVAMVSVSLATIADTPHDINAWLDLGSKQGICSYCHIPHSSKGDRLFPVAVLASGVDKTTIGEVAVLCFQCHGAAAPTEIGTVAQLDADDKLLFRALMKPTKVSDTLAAYDTHPTIYSSTYYNGLGFAEYTTTTVSGAGVVASDVWPYMNAWSAGGKDIECTSCHNPHDWNIGDKRNYLRAPWFTGTANTVGQNICSYCHTDRDSNGTGANNTTGTHPVNNLVAVNDTSTSPGIWFDIGNFFVKYTNTVTKGDVVIGDRGAHLGPNGEFTCMSCHMPHGAPNANDGVRKNKSGTAQGTLIQGPLLVKDNQNGAAGALPSHWQGETAFSIGVGESIFCEWCHGITPKKSDSVEGDTTVAMMKFSHPVNKYPTDTKDNTTYAYASNLTTEVYSTFTIALDLRYPGYTDYEESDGNHTGTGNRGNAGYLTCMSCHDPHKAKVNTPILRAGSSNEFCEDCHKRNPLPAGVSHPLKGLVDTSTVCDLETEDGGTLPNYANLYLDSSSGGNGQVVCRTCHGGPYGSGVIHGAPGRFMLGDYLEYGEICVNCHGYDSRGQIPVYSFDSLTEFRKGTAAQKSANPSYYYKEGSWFGWNEDTKQTNQWNDSSTTEFQKETVLSRVGSHYIGVFSGTRPSLTDTDWGWLGDTDTTRDPRGYLGGESTWVDTSDTGSGWFTPRKWDSTDGVSQVSILGYLRINGVPDKTRPVLICVSCHTPHGAATGAVDNASEKGTWEGELLLANNANSYMCYTCHATAKTHPVHYPNLAYALDYVSETKAAINFADTTLPYKIIRPIGDVWAPANYPPEGAAKVVCESCHSAHSAASQWGSYILEGAGGTKGWDTSATGTNIGKHNKNVKGDTARAIDHEPTCIMCHPQAD